jgi:DUF4097 and DUF4098 domain-containing protein YvlB
MTTNIRKSGCAFLIAVFALPATQSFAQQTDASFERSFDVERGLTLDVATGSGQVSIRAVEGNTARVVGSLRVHERNGGWAFWRRSSRLSEEEIEELIVEFEENPPVELVGNRLRVGHIDEQRQGFSVSFSIDVPRETDIRSRTGSGRTEIQGIEGRIEARTGSGGVSVRDVAGDVDARSGSGSIRAESIAGNFEGRAGSGSIEIEFASEGNVDVSTGSGTIRLGGLVGALSARAGSGSIIVDGEPTGDWELSTGSGSVRLRLPEEAAFSLDARTGSGGVTTEHPLTIEGNVDRNHIRGEVRGGGPLITARTGSGSVRIE